MSDEKPVNFPIEFQFIRRGPPADIEQRLRESRWLGVECITVNSGAKDGRFLIEATMHWPQKHFFVTEGSLRSGTPVADAIAALNTKLQDLRSTESFQLALTLGCAP